MTKTFCDRCGTAISDDYSDGVNLDWDYFGVVEFEPLRKEYNFCAGCAKMIDELIYGKTADIRLTVITGKSEPKEE